jgi:hypothetical protein
VRRGWKAQAGQGYDDEAQWRCATASWLTVQSSTAASYNSIKRVRRRRCRCAHALSASVPLLGGAPPSAAPRGDWRSDGEAREGDQHDQDHDEAAVERAAPLSASIFPPCALLSIEHWLESAALPALVRPHDQGGSSGTKGSNAPVHAGADDDQERATKRMTTRLALVAFLVLAAVSAAVAFTRPVSQN